MKTIHVETGEYYSFAAVPAGDFLIIKVICQEPSQIQSNLGTPDVIWRMCQDFLLVGSTFQIGILLWIKSRLIIL